MTEKPTFDYSKLRGRIVEKLGTHAEFCKAMGLCHSTISLKLTGATYFSQEQIYKAMRVLEIPPQELSAYFFTRKVEKSRQEA